MRKLFLFLIASASLWAPLHGQKNKGSENPAPDEKEREWTLQQTIYRNALRVSDLEAATFALHTMLALKPERKEFNDTLCSIYFSRGAYPQCVLTGKLILATQPNDTAVLELVSVSEQALGLGKEALEDYEKLYRLAGDLRHLYEIATLQYALKRLGECEQTIARIVQDPKVGQVATAISFGQGQSQDVPLKAAALNLQGVIFLELSKWDEAIELFNKALEVYPDFVLAKNNLQLAKDKKEGK